MKSISLLLGLSCLVAGATLACSSSTEMPTANGADELVSSSVSGSAIQTISVVPSVGGSSAGNFVLSGNQVSKLQPIIEAGCGAPTSLSQETDHPYYEFIVANPNPKDAVVDLYDTGTNAAWWHMAVYPAASSPHSDAELAACSNVGTTFLSGALGGYLTDLPIAAGKAVLVRIQAEDAYSDEPEYSTGSGALRVQTTAY